MNSMRAQDKVVLITGGARGLGESFTPAMTLTGDESSYSTGAEFVIDGGLITGMPHR